MKTTVTKVEGTYYLNVEGQEPVALIVKQPSGWDETIFLPENPSGRKLINVPKLEKALEKSPVFELTYKAPVTFGPRNTNGVKREVRKAEDFLSDEDKATLKALQEKAAAAKAEATKKAPMSELEKAKRAKERAEAALEALLAKEQANEAAHEAVDKILDKPITEVAPKSKKSKK